MTTPNWKNLLTDCFGSTTFMSLATFGPEGVWANPVYFAWDDHFNLYFISQLDCRHMNNIAANPAVAGTIFNTQQERDVCGAYITGTAKVCKTDAEKAPADKIYYGRLYPHDEKERNADGYRNDPSWHFVKITLSGLWYFDTRYFEENRMEVPAEIWRGQ